MAKSNYQIALLARTKAIVAWYRREVSATERPLSYQQFARQLSTYAAISYQSIKNWEDGVHAPDMIYLTHILDAAPEGSWQRQFAWEIIHAYAEVDE